MGPGGRWGGASYPDQNLYMKVGYIMPITPSDMDDVLKNEINGPKSKNINIKLRQDKLTELQRKFSQKLNDINIPKEDHRQVCEIAIRNAEYLVDEFKRSVVPLKEMLNKSPKFIDRFVADDAVDYYRDNDPDQTWDEDDFDPFRDRHHLDELAIGLKNLLAEMVKYLLNI